MMEQYNQALIQALMNANGGLPPQPSDVQNATNPMMSQFAQDAKQPPQMFTQNQGMFSPTPMAQQNPYKAY